MFPGPTPPSRVLVTSAIVLLMAAAAWFYAWVPAAFSAQWTSREPAGFYAELTQAFLQGQLHLARSPDPGLLSLADPYDPAQNATYRVNDLSYFQGRYYLYHGAAPVLTLLAPYHLVTGQYLTDYATAVLFCLGGAAFSLFLLAEVQRRLLPAASLGLLLGCGLTVTFGHGYYLALRSPGTNQIAIASAYFFLLVSVWSAARALLTARATWPWLLAAATAFGLAIASRPNYVFASSGLLIPMGFLWRRDGSLWTRAFRLNLAATCMPLALVVGAMLVHNYLRFGQPLEFGQRYMLGGWDQRTLGFFDLRLLAANASHYLFSPGLFDSEFPFVTAPSWHALGVLVQAPFTWLALAAGALAVSRSSPATAAPLRSLTGMLTLMFACNFGLLLLLPSGNDRLVQHSANARYVFDFLPLLMLLACLGALGVDHRLAGSSWHRAVWRWAAGALGAVTLIFALSLDFHQFPTESYRPLARVLNLPVHLAQRWMPGTAHGPLSLEVIFPAGRPNHAEPLVATGSDRGANLLYVIYDSPGTVRFGLVGTSMEGPVSPPIAVTYGQPHRLDIRMGSLYPSDGSPALASMGNAEVSRLKRMLRIDLDGRTVFEIPAHFFPSKPREVRVGSTSLLRNYAAAEFTGRIRASGRLPIKPEALAQPPGPEYGAFRLVVRFPNHKPGGTEPLLVSGVQGAGDFIYVHYVDHNQISLGLDHWGTKGLRTTWLPVDFAVNHTVEIQVGSLFPPPDHVLLAGRDSAQVEELKKRVRVLLDGEVVLDAIQPTYESSPYDVLVGRNAIGGSTCSYQFSGEIISAERQPLPGTGR